MILLKIVLFPFSVLYDLITTLRNRLYDAGYFKSRRFPVKLISVGNLTVGGTGKSPVVEYLIRKLAGERNICTLSRGYGRKSKGFFLANHDSDAERIGDEPFQFYLKFASQIHVAVGEDRSAAIDKITNKVPKTDLTILDDAFQHRAVTPHFSILVTDYNRLFYKDFLLPAGRLRESAVGARRADVVLVSKGPENLSSAEKQTIINEIRKKAGKEIEVFFTGIKYFEPVSFHGKDTWNPNDKAIAFTGIAKPELFYNYLHKHYSLSQKISFPDHHNYSTQDIHKIFEAGKDVNDRVSYITTEKDMARLLKSEYSKILKNYKIFYLPIQIEFLDREEEFMNVIRKAVFL